MNNCEAMRRSTRMTAEMEKRKRMAVFSGSVEPEAGRRDRTGAGHLPGQCEAGEVRQRRNLRSLPGKRSRRRCVHRAVRVLEPQRLRRQRQPHGAAHHDRRRQARQRAQRQRRHHALRLRAPGPQGRSARAHHRQAGGRPARPPPVPTTSSPSTCTRTPSRASSTCRSTT